MTMAERSDDIDLTHNLTTNSIVVVVLYEKEVQNEQQMPQINDKSVLKYKRISG